MVSKVSDDKSSNTYYQSVDHLGSTNVLTDDKGEFYEHIETFPDGSIWVKEYVDQSGVNAVFTCHEMDVETKFFYAKARYYDAQLGRFISVDPIIGSYLPNNTSKKKKTEMNDPYTSLAGKGGVYNPSNMNLYHYAGNNPIMLFDSTGLEIEATFKIFRIQKKSNGKGSTAYGYLIVKDLDTGVKVVAKVVSGGKPFGDPIPEGNYDILDNKKNGGFWGYFRLESIDKNYGDDTHQKTGRDELRLHLKGSGTTTGCISVNDYDRFNDLVKLLNSTKKSKVKVKSKSRNPFKRTENKIKYGTLKIEYMNKNEK